jgi:lambda family phage portal protein
MNLLDKAISYFSPERGARRMAARQMTKTLQTLNSGYSEGGASAVKKSMRGWLAPLGSPKEDIDENLETLRARSRDLYMTSPLAAAALKTVKTNVIGPGLRLKPQIDAEKLGVSPEEAEAWGRNTVREFGLWAESVDCDALRISDFYDQQPVAFLSCLMNGDAGVIFKKAKRTAWMPYTLRLHLIEADRICNPTSASYINGIEGRNPDNGNRIINGVEVDELGAVIAYWICNVHPHSTGLDAVERKLWVRVEAYGKDTGRPNILLLFEAERAEQRRGVPYLAPVIEAIKQMTRYTEAEIMAAVISSMFTVFVKTNGPSSENNFGEMVSPDQQVSKKENESVYEMGIGAVNVLAPDEDIEIADPKRPNTAFEPFMNAMCYQIGAALEIPHELLLKSFKASYSAARAALLEAWKMFRSRRSWIAKDFCQPVYEEWLAEAVAIGRVRAPGFFNDPAIRRAWCGAEWIGPAPGQLDPSKEVAAAKERINLGISTRERETLEMNGGDIERNVKQLRREAELMNSIKPVKAAKGGETRSE